MTMSSRSFGIERWSDTRPLGLGLLTAAATALLLGGCASAVSDTAVSTATLTQPAEVTRTAVRREEKVVKIGLILPFGAIGSSAALAKSMKQAAEMALFDRADLQFQIMPFDDKGTPEGAKAAAEAAKADGAELVLGPLFAASVTAAAAVTRASNIPLVAFSNDRQVAGRGVYLISSLPEDEVRRVVEHALDQGKRRFAALIPDDAYGAVVESTLRALLTERRATLVAFEKFSVGANGAVEPARRLVERLKEAADNDAAAEALLIPGSAELVGNLSPLLTYAGLEPGKVQILGTSGMDGSTLGRDALLRGARFAGPDPRGWQDFAIRFSKAFGSPPPRIAGLAFDAMTVAATLATEPPATRYSARSLSRPVGFQGIDGTILFSETGVPKRALAILEVGEAAPIVIEPAPNALGGSAAATAPVPSPLPAPVPPIAAAAAKPFTDTN